MERHEPHDVAAANDADHFAPAHHRHAPNAPLNQQEAEKTPLQKKLDELTKVFVLLGGIAIALVIVFGLLRGESIDTLFLTGVALTIASIPTKNAAPVTGITRMSPPGRFCKRSVLNRCPMLPAQKNSSGLATE